MSKGAQEMNLFEGRRNWRRRGFSMCGRRGGEQGSSRGDMARHMEASKGGDGGGRTLARCEEAARRLKCQIRGWPSSLEGKNRGGKWRRLGKRGIGTNE